MWQQVVRFSEQWAPAIIAAAISVLIVGVASWLMRRRYEGSASSHLGIIGPVITFALVGIGLIATILSLPIGDAARGQLLGILGLLVTGAIALSSTTFLGNAMAGIMLRAIRHFRPGDYVRVGENIGRVSDLGILHTEIQTEDRDLTTLPNLYLVTHPVTVLHASGTVVSAQVSLGYEIAHGLVEKQLIEAAGRAGLADPFVQVVELGDSAILYRAAGFLTEIRHLLTTRSNLRKAMLDALHEAQIEIVSPSFTNCRRLSADDVFVPSETRKKMRRIETPPESRIFDKADAAEARAKIQDEIEAQQRRIAELEVKIASSSFDAEKSELTEELARATERRTALEQVIIEEAGE